MGPFSLMYCLVLTLKIFLIPRRQTQPYLLCKAARKIVILTTILTRSVDSEYYDKEWRLVAVGVENADPVCVKLNDLIQRGKVSKDQILYKYLKDVIEVYYDPRHEYDKEVIEFFNTLSYLGGRRTTNMIRGPMFAGQGRGSVHDTENCRMNLGDPSEETCRKKTSRLHNKIRCSEEFVQSLFKTLVIGKWF